eukprot:m.9337 g.9337  ORF g.9337 m.9337 type:complete len:377 (+) comp3431_c0_seq1:85-1215(+)
MSDEERSWKQIAPAKRMPPLLHQRKTMSEMSTLRKKTSHPSMHFSTSSTQHSVERMKRDATAFLLGISLTGQLNDKLIYEDEDNQCEKDIVDQNDSVMDVRQNLQIIHVNDLHKTEAKQLVGTRLIFATSGDRRCSPFSVCSIIPLAHPKKRRVGDKKKFEVLPIKRTKSFQKDLRRPPVFHLHMDLDDPYLLHGHYQKVLQLPSYTVSISRAVTPGELKESLNNTFKEKFPLIKLTLSKLRSLKRDMVFIACERCKMQISTVALAHYFFETLVLQGWVTKPTRKLIPACCILLAFKFNSEERPSLVKLQLKPFFKICEEKWRLSQSDILGMEVRVYSKLGFSLEVDASTLQAYMKRILLTHPHLERAINLVEYVS